MSDTTIIEIDPPVNQNEPQTDAIVAENATVEATEEVAVKPQPVEQTEV